MSAKRIVSFLPSATELIFQLGAQDRLFGVTHECNFPIDASKKPRVIESVFEQEKMSSQEIDDKVCELSENKDELFRLVTKNLINANPDLIISQEICEVCSAYTSQVKQALEILEDKPDVYSMNPSDVNGVLTCAKEISEKIGMVQKGNEIVNSLNLRIEKIRKMNFQSRPNVLAIEWLEPFFTAGHWVPEMIEISGGNNLITKIGDHSRKMDIKEIEDADPDFLLMMPCGFDVNRTILEYNKYLKENSRWNQIRAVKDGNVFSVDANSFFSKPSIRIVEGIEILAKILHSDVIDLDVPPNSFLKI